MPFLLTDEMGERFGVLVKDCPVDFRYRARHMRAADKDMTLDRACTVTHLLRKERGHPTFPIHAAEIRVALIAGQIL